MVKGIYATIGTGNASVWIEYTARKDYDHRGDFWDVDWDGVRVFLGEADITDTVGMDVWEQIEVAIDKDLYE